MKLFAEMFQHQAERQPDHPAITAGSETLTYGMLVREMAIRAAALQETGMKPGTRIALLQNRTTGLCTDLLACLWAGLPVTVLSRSEGISSVITKLQETGFAYVVADDANADAAQNLENNGGPPVLIRSQMIKPSPCLPHAADPEDEALLIFTSGTSGVPKAVRLCHRNIAANTAGLFKITPIGQNDHYLHLMPLSHTNGILNQVLFPLLWGAQITFLSRFTPEDTLSTMARIHPTVVTGVPTMLQRLLDHPMPAGATDALRMLRCGSAPLAADTQTRIEEHIGRPVLISYGQTEFTCTSTATPPDAPRKGSVGRAVGGAEVGILGPTDDQKLAAKVRGEVAFRGPLMSLGYDGGETFNPEEWFRSGDLGYLDEDGYLFLTGRLKDIIIRGGENLAPPLIEDVLLTCPGIRAACVVPKPHDDLGEVPFAFIEVSGTVAPLDHLNEKIRDVLGNAHCLSGIEVIDRLPENNVGKVNRKLLTSQLAEGA